MRDQESSPVVWYVVRRTLQTPIALTFGGILLVGLLALSPVLLVIGGGGLAGYIAWRIRDKKFVECLRLQRQQELEAKVEGRIETEAQSFDYETRQRVRYILQLRREVAQECRAEDVPGYVAEELARVSAQLMALVERAVEVAEKKRQISRYLSQIDDAALKRYVGELRRRIEETEDPITRGQYEQALAAREAELASFRAIKQASARIDGQLENVEATLSSWKAQVLRLKSTDETAASFGEDLRTELSRLRGEIDVLDASVAEALATTDETRLRAQG